MPGRTGHDARNSDFSRAVAGRTVTLLEQLEAPGELVSLRDEAARVVHARHRGVDGEDLVQEAWARVAAALTRHAVADPGAYTRGVAANLVRAECRRDGARERWAPRLFMRASVEPPDIDLLRREQ